MVKAIFIRSHKIISLHCNWQLKKKIDFSFKAKYLIGFLLKSCIKLKFGH